MLVSLSGIIWNYPIIPADYIQGLFDLQIPDNYSWLNDEMVYLNGESVLMQHTVLKDKNGKEIYEGDIVEAQLYKSTRRFVVEWNSIANHSSFGAGTHNIEVIGNIFEGGHLLKEDYEA